MRHFKTTLILVIIALAAFGCSFNYSVGVPKNPTTEDAQKLVKETMRDFADAIKTEDFEKLRRRTAAAFQQQYTAQEVSESLSVFTSKKDLAVPAFLEAAKVTPEFAENPQMREVNKIYYLALKGNSNIGNQSLKFDFEYVREDGQWKLIRFNVKA